MFHDHFIQYNKLKFAVEAAKTESDAKMGASNVNDHIFNGL